jgi:predicted Zn-dependent protease
MVSRGLIKCATSEDALAAVLAHEIAHIQSQHSLDAIQTSRITDAITKTGYATMNVLSKGELLEFTDTFGDVVDDIIGEMVDSGYSKSQEFEADEKALSIMAKAGYYPKAMEDMLFVLKEKSNAQTGWGKTHPSPKERIKNLENLYKKYSVEDFRESRQPRFLEATKDI